MTERKCEWLESDEWNRLLHAATTPIIHDYISAKIALEHFIRASVEEERKSDSEEIDRLRSALKSQADWCDRYEQFASIHDDGEERLYAAQCAREMRQALEQSAPEEVKNDYLLAD